MHSYMGQRSENEHFWQVYTFIGTVVLGGNGTSSTNSWAGKEINCYVSAAHIHLRSKCECARIVFKLVSVHI